MRGKEERLFILVFFCMGSIECDDQAEAVDAFNLGFGVARLITGYIYHPLVQTEVRHT
jgi:hypothetical protein